MDHFQDDNKIDCAELRTRSEHREVSFAPHEARRRGAPHRHPYQQLTDVKDIPCLVIPRRGASLRKFTASTGSYIWPRIEHTTSFDERPSLGARPLTDDDGSFTSSPASSRRSGCPSRPMDSPPFFSFPLPPLNTDRRHPPSAMQPMLLEPMRRMSLADMDDDGFSSSSSSNNEMGPVAITTSESVSSPTLRQMSSRSPTYNSPTTSHPAPPPCATSSIASGTTPSTGVTVSTSAFTVDSVDPVNRNAWEQYAKRDPDGIYMCLCQDEKTGNACRYVCHRQNMKRHVEIVHMKILRYVCDLCGLRFSQKTNVCSHLSSRHTGVKSNICPHDGCVWASNDPAALLRHKVNAHGYVPKFTKRQAGRPCSAQTESEEGMKYTKSV